MLILKSPRMSGLFSAITLLLFIRSHFLPERERQGLHKLCGANLPLSILYPNLAWSSLAFIAIALSGHPLPLWQGWGISIAFALLMAFTFFKIILTAPAIPTPRLTADSTLNISEPEQVINLFKR